MISKETDVSKSSFGVWKICRKTKTRYYVDLTGAVFREGAAFRQYLADRRSDHLARVREARRELFSSVLEKCRHDRLQAILRAGRDGEGMRSLQQLESWGICGALLSHYHSLGVRQLFEWQVHCLLMQADLGDKSSRQLQHRKPTDTAPTASTSGLGHGASVLDGGNLVYSAPTSGGKTLVAELLMLLQFARCWAEAEEYQSRHDRQQQQSAGACAAPTGEATPALGGSVLFVVPFVSLAEEKGAALQALWAPYGVRTRAYHGEAADDGAAGLATDVDLAICTIEKANILYTRLVEVGRERQVRCVVVDELHMLADSNRGFVLEILCSKLKFLGAQAEEQERRRKQDHGGGGDSASGRSVQLIGMSATLPNMREIGSSWLRAAVYITEYRPVSLSSYACIGRTLLTASTGADRTRPGMELERAGKTVGYLRAQDPQSQALTGRKLGHAQLRGAESTDHLAPDRDADGFLFLCLEPMLAALGQPAAAAVETAPAPVPAPAPGSHNVLVFCSSKARCESCVMRVVGAVRQLISEGALLAYPQSFQRRQPAAGPLAPEGGVTGSGPRFTMGGQGAAPESLEARLRALHEARNALMYNLLTQTVVGLCPLLRQSLPYGVAYHHAGLTLDERKVGSVHGVGYISSLL